MQIQRLPKCYFTDNEKLIKDVVSTYNFDFVTGSVHWIDGFGFDHRAELWNGVNVDMAYKRYYEIMLSLIESKIFTGVAHPDSIKCFGHFPSFDLTNTYQKLALALNRNNMYAEQSGGLVLRYNGKHGTKNVLGMNESMLEIFQKNGVRLLTASDAHKPEDVGANIKELNRILGGAVK